MATQPSPPSRRASAMIGASSLSSLGDLLADAFVQFKTNVALVEDDRKMTRGTWTYADVAANAVALAKALSRSDVTPESRVAIVMSNQSKWLFAASAVIARGGVLVPIDYKLTAPEQRALVIHSGAKALFCDWPVLAAFGEAAPPVDVVIVSDAPEGVALPANAVRWESVLVDAARTTFDEIDRIIRARNDTATIVYSSGTGGAPKGCLLSHGAYLAQYESLTALFPMTEGDRFFSILPTNHAIDFMCGFIGPFGGGATVVHQRTLRPELILHTLRTHKITHIAVVPLLLAAFERSIREKIASLSPFARAAIETAIHTNALVTERAPNRAISRRLLAPIHEAFGGELRTIFCGGAFTPPERARFFYDIGLPVVIGYGLTECCTVATVNDLAPFRADTVGRPVRGVEVRIANPSTDGVGDVVIRGPTLMSGYLDDPDQTAETLRDGWLRTGDVGRIDPAGHLQLLGRAKNMIVTAGGKNVYPEDVESAFEGVAAEELVVVASDFVFPRRGRLSDEELVVVLRPRQGDDGGRRAIGEIRARNRRLSDYKRCGSVLVTKTAFPRTASMKVRRGALAEQLRDLHSRSELVELEPRSEQLDRR